MGKKKIEYEEVLRSLCRAPGINIRDLSDRSQVSVSPAWSVPASPAGILNRASP